MRPRFLLALILVFYTSFAAERADTRLNFPGLGQVLIHPVRENGAVPYVDFFASTGERLLRVEPETGNFWKVDDVQDATGSHIYYGALHLSDLPDPLVLVVLQYGFASDCGYTPALVGVRNGRLEVLTPKLERFLTRGGAYWKKASSGHPAQLTIIAERYRSGEVHVNGPSKVAVYRYSFDAGTGKFVLIQQEIIPVDKLKVEGESLLATIPGLTDC
jgi:hypothetical protein